MISETVLGHLNNRYQLFEQLGAGSMGVIYRALDRLTGEEVALKRVQISSSHSTDEMLMALVREFRMLASLRHPHIIDVLDYGFDSQRQPFYTMGLLQGAQNVVAYARNAPLETKIRVISEMLLALTYLHRRGVLHRDLKPANVLVSGAGTVRVVDFGLAVIAENSSRSLDDLTAGTMAYMAPELFRGERVSPYADIYGVGVMAYEIFAGRHPFNTKNLGVLVADVTTRQPDLSLIPNAYRSLIGTMLAKTRDERARMGETFDLYRALFEASQQSIPREAVAIRESYLQSARFVGRDAEMKQLSEALSEAVRSRGAAWLIGGESGVGKSRLVSELRTLALVSGVTVATAQEVREPANPYHVWAHILRRLVLQVNPESLNEMAAGILHTIIPDLAVLIGRDIPTTPPPSGEADAAQARLRDTVIALLRAQPVGALIILEDFQWAAAESITLLEGVSRAISELPVLIVVTYRDDERPLLPEELPLMRSLKLGRLEKRAIAELSAAILGNPGRSAAVVEFLQRESEGNAFFVVEVIRALGENTRDLTEVGMRTLPKSVFAGGVTQIVNQRLQRIPASGRPLLNLAGVVGRQIDLDLLARVTPDIDLQSWLSMCADAGVLDVQDGVWRFAHDKLRESVLSALSVEERTAIHRRVAVALEAAYREAGEPIEGAARLAHHWSESGDVERERVYMAFACEASAISGAYKQAKICGERAMTLAQQAQQAQIEDAETDESALIDPAWLGRLYGALGTAYAGLGDYVLSRRCFEEQLTIARSLQDKNGIAEALGNLSSTAWRSGNYQEAWQFASDSEVIFRSLGILSGVAGAVETLSRVARWLGDNDISRQYALEALTIYTELGNRYGISEAHNNLGLVAQMVGDFPAAFRHFQESLRITRAIGTTERNMHQTLNNLGIVSATLGRYDEARRYFTESLELAYNGGNQRMVANLLSNLGSIALQTRDYAEAQKQLNESLTIARDIGHKRIVAWALANLGALAVQLGVFPEADARYQESLQVADEIKERWLIANAIAGLGDIARAQDRPQDAWSKYREALTMFVQIKAVPTALTLLINVAHLMISIGREDTAAVMMGMVMKNPSLNGEGRTAAADVLMTLEMALGVGGLAAAMKTGETLTFDQGIDQILGGEWMPNTGG